MDIKFCTNKIPTSKVTLDDLVNKKIAERTGGQVKTASAEAKEAAEECDEADSSGQPEWEGKPENNNEPEVDAEAKATVETKEAGSNEDDCAEGSGQLDVEPLHQKSKRDIGESKSKAKSECKCEGECTCGCGKKAEAEVAGPRFVKLSKLDEKTKKFLKEYWANIHPAEYVDAMLAEY